MKKKPHGNSHQNMEEHHLYEIRDRERGGVYKYGICGDPLTADGSSPRANKQVRLFNRVVGWARFLANVLLTGIAGRLKAEKKEKEYIEKYEKKYGRKPPGNE